MKFCFSLVLCILCVQISHAQELMVLKSSGKVVIGDTTQISTPGLYNLYVQNGVMTEKVKVAVKNASDWSDHSFGLTPSLSEVKQSIENSSHLHNMPSAEQLVREGYDLREMDSKLLEQIEWLWQYTIKISEENLALKKEIEALNQKLYDEK